MVVEDRVDLEDRKRTRDQGADRVGASSVAGAGLEAADLPDGAGATQPAGERCTTAALRSDDKMDVDDQIRVGDAGVDSNLAGGGASDCAQRIVVFRIVVVQPLIRVEGAEDPFAQDDGSVPRQ